MSLPVGVIVSRLRSFYEMKSIPQVPSEETALRRARSDRGNHSRFSTRSTSKHRRLPSSIVASYANRCGNLHWPWCDDSICPTGLAGTVGETGELLGRPALARSADSDVEKVSIRNLLRAGGRQS